VTVQQSTSIENHVSVLAPIEHHSVTAGKRFLPLSHGDAEVRLKSGTALTLSRNYRSGLL